MSKYTGVYSTRASAAFSGSRELIGLTAPSDRGIEIIRAELGLYSDTTPPTDMLRCTMGPVTASGNGGPNNENPLHPNYPTAGTVATSNGATQHTLTSHQEFAFHIQHGMLFLPVPEERPGVAGGDEWGWNLQDGPAASQSFAWHVVWGEL